ncbi:hypothetical protein ACFFSW_17630 [Saccharothrix longispora]|uniref:Recombination endonuclease VII n=1 Tax=Saccharothrix longispora TaxID=33920 RepID=A0ABU1PSI8_9PSEU|nr:hypothetical protein [Saccharothrix longispora]MDR6593605.1 hypothetical protein [Saccharothrix longispora]
MVNTADPQTLALMGKCAATLSSYPYDIAVAKLRNAWQRTANPEDRAVIAACVPAQDPGLYHPDTTSAPRYGRGNYQAPRNSNSRHEHSARRTVPEQRRRSRAQNEPRTVTEYSQTRAGVDDAPARAERPIAYELDYDRAAVADLRTRPCVWCAGERAVIDVHTDRVKTGHGDDGLCTECRSLDRPGIPELPTGHTYTDAIHARCVYHVTHGGMPAVRAEWRRAMRHQRRLAAATIEQWATTHQQRHAAVTIAEGVPCCAHCDANLNNNPNPLDVPNQHDQRTAPHDPRYCSRTCAAAAEDTPEPQPQPDREQEPQPETAPTVDGGSCETCGDVKQVRQGLCLDCRRLEQQTPQEPQQHAEPAAA